MQGQTPAGGYSPQETDAVLTRLRRSVGQVQSMVVFWAIVNGLFAGGALGGVLDGNSQIRVFWFLGAIAGAFLGLMSGLFFGYLAGLAMRWGIQLLSACDQVARRLEG